jgi:hypothetical protein
MRLEHHPRDGAARAVLNNRAACKNVDVNSDAREGLLAAPLRHSSGHFASTFVTTAVERLIALDGIHKFACRSDPAREVHV